MFDDFSCSSSDMFGDTSLFDSSADLFADVNPATGLPMTAGVGSLDVGGNLWGCCDSLSSEASTESMFDW
jgi:hypothetical protein